MVATVSATSSTLDRPAAHSGKHKGNTHNDFQPNFLEKEERKRVYVLKCMCFQCFTYNYLQNCVGISRLLGPALHPCLTSFFVSKVLTF